MESMESNVVRARTGQSTLSPGSHLRQSPTAPIQDFRDHFLDVIGFSVVAKAVGRSSGTAAPGSPEMQLPTLLELLPELSSEEDFACLQSPAAFPTASSSAGDTTDHEFVATSSNAAVGVSSPPGGCTLSPKDSCSSDCWSIGDHWHSQQQQHQLQQLSQEQFGQRRHPCQQQAFCGSVSKAPSAPAGAGLYPAATAASAPEQSASAVPTGLPPSTDSCKGGPGTSCKPLPSPPGMVAGSWPTTPMPVLLQAPMASVAGGPLVQFSNLPKPVMYFSHRDNMPLVPPAAGNCAPAALSSVPVTATSAGLWQQNQQLALLWSGQQQQEPAQSQQHLAQSQQHIQYASRGPFMLPQQLLHDVAVPAAVLTTAVPYAAGMVAAPLLRAAAVLPMQPTNCQQAHLQRQLALLRHQQQMAQYAMRAVSYPEVLQKHPPIQHQPREPSAGNLPSHSVGASSAVSAAAAAAAGAASRKRSKKVDGAERAVCKKMRVAQQQQQQQQPQQQPQQQLLQRSQHDATDIVSDMTELLVPNGGCKEGSGGGVKFDRECVASKLQQLSDGELLLLAAKVVNSTPVSLAVQG